MERSNEQAGRSVLWRSFLGLLGLLTLAEAVPLAYFLLGPTKIDAFGWRPAKSPGLSGPYVSNDALTRGRLLTTRWVEAGNYDRNRYQGVGPEHIVIDPDGHLYTGLCDAGPGGTLDKPPACRFDENPQGWVVRINPKHPQEVVPFVRTGGRPLGMAFDSRGRLYIADGEMGLLRVEDNLNSDSSNGTAEYRTVVKVATCNRDDDDPDRMPDYTDSVAIAADDTVFFTCPSQRWGLEDIRNEILENKPTGRLLSYTPCDKPDPMACDKEIILDKLMFANGVVVEETGSLLVNEWTGFRVIRVQLGEKGQSARKETFFGNLPGYPDNLTLDADGTVWIGLSLARQDIVDRFRPHPFLMNALARLPESSIELQRFAWVVALGRDGPQGDLGPKGKLKWSLQDTTGLFDQATGAYPDGDALYIGSYTDQSILCIARPGVALEFDPCNPWMVKP